MNYKRKILKNGMRIITVPMKDNPTVTVMALVEAGSKYESKDINGISHFLEHMCFKGTEKRSLHDITYELDALGAQSNAFTGNEYTGYWAKGHYKKFPKLLDIIADIYLNATFPKDEIEKERGVIIEEINMYEDQPQAKVAEVLDHLMYGDQPAGWTIAGPKENIRKISREDFLAYRSKHYVAKGTVVVVAGNIESVEAEKQIVAAFEKIPTSKKHDKLKVKESQKSPGVKLHFKETDQSHLILAFRSFDRYDKKNYPAELLSVVLGKGMSSRLFKKLRDELGLCYYIGAANHAQTDHGCFVVRAGVAKDRVNEAIEAILSELKKIKRETVSEGELKKAKDFKIGNLALNMESSDSFADFYGFQELHHDEMLTPKAHNEKLRAVTAAEVKKIAGEIFQDKNLNLAVVGPHKDEKQFLRFLHL